MKLSTKVAYNTIIQIVAKLVSTIIGLAAVAILARYLGQFGFGQYTTVITYVSFFAIAADLGLTLVTVQMISQPDADEPKMLGNLLSLRLVSALLFLSIAPLSIFLLPYSPEIKKAAIIASFSFLFAALNQVFVGLFQKRLRMDKVAIAEILSRLVLLAGIYMAVKLDYGLNGVFVAMAVSGAFGFILHLLFALGYSRISLQFDPATWKKIISQSWPIAVTIIFNLIYLKTDTLILSLIKSQEEVGIYGAAYRVVDVLITVPFMFAGIILPIMTLDWAKKELAHLRSVLQKSFNLMMILAIPMVVGTQFVAGKAMAVIAGQSFFVSGAVLQVLIIAVGLIFPGCLFSHVVIAINRQKNIIGAYIFVSVTSVIGYLIFIPKYSYFGAAWVTIYSELAIAAAAAYLTWKYARIFPKMGVMLKSLLSALIMAAFLFLSDKFMPNARLLSDIVLGALVYMISLYLMGGVKKEEVMELLKNK